MSAALPGEGSWMHPRSTGGVPILGEDSVSSHWPAAGELDDWQTAETVRSEVGSDVTLWPSQWADVI